MYEKKLYMKLGILMLGVGKSTGVDLKTNGKRFPEVSRESCDKFRDSKGFEKYTTKHRSGNRNGNLN